MLERGLELDTFLGSEPSQFIGLDNLGRLCRPALLQFVDGLQSKALCFQVIICDVSGVGLLISSSIRCALEVDSYVRQLLLEDLRVHSYFLAQRVVDLLLDRRWVFLGLRLPYLRFD